jgi:hypothetical protein
MQLTNLISVAVGRKQPQGDFSGCTTPTGLDGRDPFDLHQLGKITLDVCIIIFNMVSLDFEAELTIRQCSAMFSGGRMLQHSNSANELMLRRKLEEEQQDAEFQHAVELQSRRLMGLQLLDLKSRVAAAAAARTAAMTPTTPVANPTTTSQPGASTFVESQPESGMNFSDGTFSTC